MSIADPEERRHVQRRRDDTLTAGLARTLSGHLKFGH